MRYSLKTGRSYYGFGDKIPDFKNKQKQKEYIALNTEIFATRPKGSISKARRFAKIPQFAKFFFNSRKNTQKIKAISNEAKRSAVLKYTMLYTVSTAIMSVILFGSVKAVGFRISDRAVVNGVTVGIVDDRENFQKIVNSVELSLSDELGREISEFSDIKFEKQLCFAGDITNDYVLKQNLRSICGELTPAYSVYVDDVYVTSASDKDEITSALNKLKELYTYNDPSRENVTVDFAQKVEIRSENVQSSQILKGGALFDAISAEKTQPKLYTVREGDNIWSISSKFGMSVDDLKKANAGINGDLQPGNTINVARSLPVITVRTSYVQKTEKKIPYTNERIDDPDLFAGATEIVTEGANGKKNVVESIIEYNGEIVMRKTESEIVLEEPQSGVIKVGSKVRTNMGSGWFIRPTEGVISSRFGARWGRIHYGIDIAANKGQIIKAADDGVVVAAELRESYGNLVVVDHGDGIQTYYAHCSEFIAEVGQNVKQGDPIAKVGSTGNSTGPHLHFEVRYEGNAINPEKFVDYESMVE